MSKTSDLIVLIMLTFAVLCWGGGVFTGAWFLLRKFFKRLKGEK
jgi:uncharacterized protein YneF (UPF0154 family)